MSMQGRARQHLIDGALLQQWEVAQEQDKSETGAVQPENGAETIPKSGLGLIGEKKV